jgi:diaminopimelate decarboxylase
VTAFDLSLLPASATVDASGSVSVGGVALVDLANEFGTPLYVYDEDELRRRCRAYYSHFGADAAYASKAFSCVAMARLVAEEGLGIDVATGGELHVARRAGFPSDRIVVHGNNKSDDELVGAIQAEVGRIVVDSFDELIRLERLAARGARVPALQVRVTPGIAANTHAYIETGTEDSKFGFGLENGEALEAAVRIHGHAALRLAGLHCHIGSQVLDTNAFARAVERMVGLVRDVEARTGVPIEEVNIGGGLGVRYLPDDRATDIQRYSTLVREAFDKAVADSGVRSRPRLMTEPGRSIAAPAGITLYRVGTIKAIPNVRTYVAVDGGMSDNLRPVTYGARYEAFLPARASAPRELRATVAGKHCEQGDLLVRDAMLPDDVAVGDVLAIPVTGGYGHSLASNYNKVPRPAVVFVREGGARVVVRRETYDDLVGLDVVGLDADG